MTEAIRERPGSASLPLEILAPLGCVMQTGVVAALNTLKPAKGSVIAIACAGTVGIAAIIAAKVANCDPILAIDINDDRLGLALPM